MHIYILLQNLCKIHVTGKQPNSRKRFFWRQPMVQATTAKQGCLVRFTARVQQVLCNIEWQFIPNSTKWIIACWCTSQQYNPLFSSLRAVPVSGLSYEGKYTRDRCWYQGPGWLCYYWYRYAYTNSHWNLYCYKAGCQQQHKYLMLPGYMARWLLTINPILPCITYVYLYKSVRYTHFTT